MNVKLGQFSFITMIALVALSYPIVISQVVSSTNNDPHRTQKNADTNDSLSKQLRPRLSTPATDNVLAERDPARSQEPRTSSSPTDPAPISSASRLNTAESLGELVRQAQRRGV